MNPDYPIYLVSKGRWESRLTSKALERMGMPYRIVVEPQEYDDYAAVIDRRKILILPFSNLGKGSIPARNWIWEDAIERGAKRHWILDDNIAGFRRFHKNDRIRVGNGTIFKAAEDFIDRYTNVALAGFQYSLFGVTTLTRGILEPFLLNTRIYSCILIQNDIPFRWRGRYNEDTDLSLRVLKAGYCTILFYAFLADKATTMQMKGGNTEELYRGDGRLKMARSLRRQHPRLVKIGRRWGRHQHIVDYSPFRANRLIEREGLEIREGINNYGMELRKCGE